MIYFIGLFAYLLRELAYALPFLKIPVGMILLSIRRFDLIAQMTYDY